MGLAQSAIEAEVLETLKTDVLEKELQRRWECFAKGNCSYCGKPLTSFPQCRATTQHGEVDDPRYEVKVGTLTPPQLKSVINKAMVAVTKEFPPRTGVVVFAFDFGEGGGLAYTSNANRDDVVKMLVEWLRRVTGRN